MSRFKEASTWGGIGILLMALNQIFDINEAGEVGRVMSEAAATGNTGLVVGSGIAALAAILIRDKK